MKYTVHGKKIKVTDDLKKYVEEKIKKLDKYFENSEEFTATVVIKNHEPLQKIEVTIPTDNFILRNEAVNEDLYAAIDNVSDKLERQIRKNKEKINKKQNKTVIKDFEFLLEDEFENDEKIVKRKKLELKPIDEEEAIIEMEMLGHNFFVFKDVDSEKICVLYKRKNGNYGIIETK